MESQEFTFETSRGLRLFERVWLPDGMPRADVAIVHGYAEHSGRYAHVAAYLVDRGYAVSAFDLRGHGKSEGPRVLVRSFNEYLDDLDAFLARVRARAGSRPLFLLGHSMGGGVAALAEVTRRPPIDGLLLSGASTDTAPAPRIVVGLTRLLGRFLPRLKLTKIASSTVSRDPAVVAGYDTDPLNYRGRVTAGLAAAMIRATKTIRENAEKLDMPLLIMHGSEDALVPVEVSRTLYDRASSRDKTLKIYDGLYHEILNEPEQLTVLADIADWIDARIATPSAAAL